MFIKVSIKKCNIENLANFACVQVYVSILMHWIEDKYNFLMLSQTAEHFSIFY